MKNSEKNVFKYLLNFSDKTHNKNICVILSSLFIINTYRRFYTQIFIVCNVFKNTLIFSFNLVEKKSTISAYEEHN